MSQRPTAKTTANHTAGAENSTEPPKSMRAHWSLNDETKLIEFLKERRAEAGDGMNFKGSTWSAAAAELKEHTKTGGYKNPTACKNKWAKVRTFDPQTKLDLTK
jgi:hypothetical protein